jgi:hypothetical protein
MLIATLSYREASCAAVRCRNAGVSQGGFAAGSTPGFPSIAGAGLGWLGFSIRFAGAVSAKARSNLRRP